MATKNDFEPGIASNFEFQFCKCLGMGALKQIRLRKQNNKQQLDLNTIAKTLILINNI